MNTKYKSTLHKHLAAILKDLPPNLCLKQLTPGKIQLGSACAWPVLTAGKGSVFLAAGELGRGRIVVAAHDVFGKNLTDKVKKKQPFVDKLQENVLRWLRKDDVTDGASDVMEVTDLRQLLEIPVGVKVIVYSGVYLSGDQRAVEKTLEQFIERGGGFLHAVTPWGYLQIHRGHVDSILFHCLLRKAGLCYSEDYISVPDDTYQTPLLDDVDRYVDAAVLENPLFDYMIRLESVANTVLEDIILLPNPGSPGLLMAYSSQAYPLILNTSGKILIAASEFGSGRIIAMSHNTYAVGLIDDSAKNAQVKKLQENMINWLSKGKVVKREKFADVIVDITGDESIKQITEVTRVVVWNHVESGLSPTSQQKVTDFVESGGGLLHAVTPWAYYNYSTQKSIPLHGLLKRTGLTYSDRYDVMYDTEQGFPVALNEHYYSMLQKENLFEASFDEGEFLNSGVLLPHMKYLDTMVTSQTDFQDQLLIVHNNNFINLKKPKITDPVCNNTDKSMVVLNDVLSRQRIPGLEVAEGTEIFPGLPTMSEDVPKDLKRAKIVELELEAYTTEDTFLTGCYVKPGELVKVQVLSQSSKQCDWSVKIGAHSDILYPDAQTELKRFPHIQVTTALDRDEVETSSPYGGLMYLHKEESSDRVTLTVRLSNVLMAPCYDLRSVASLGDWSDRKWCMSPWADVSGEYITITLPTKSVEQVSDLADVMRRWDRVVRLMHFLRGSEVRSVRRQWIVCDAQPSAGYMHAGYPVVTHLDVADPQNSAFFLGGNWKDFWGFYHELGHNFQRDAWTFTGSTEVTCNIFSMYMIDQLCGQSPLNGDWVKGQIQHITTCLKSGDYSFAGWMEDAGLGVGVYAQLCEYLGWPCMCHVFRQYEAMAKETLPSSDEDKINVWFTTCSEASQSNLAPLFQFWDWPISLKAKAQVSHFKPFLPDDEITQSVPEKVEEIKIEFKDLVRSVDKRQFPYLFEASSKQLKVRDV